MTLTNCGARYDRQVPNHSFPVAKIASASSATINRAIATATSSKNAFCCLKDFQRIATRYDKLAANFLSGVALATDVAAWL